MVLSDIFPLTDSCAYAHIRCIDSIPPLLLSLSRRVAATTQKVINNTLLESAGIATKSCDEKFDLCNEGVNPFDLYNGPLNSAVVIRSNLLEHGQGISVDGTTYVHAIGWVWLVKPESSSTSCTVFVSVLRVEETQ